MTDQTRIRQAVRAVVLDPDDRVLLVRHEFPDSTIWAAPGGGMEQYENPDHALRRELMEETGLVSPQIGPEVWRRTHHFGFLDGSFDGQSERYFLTRTDAFEPEPAMAWEELRQEGVTGIKWWSPEELASAGCNFAPSRLPQLVARLIRDGPPPEPLDVGA